MDIQTYNHRAGGDLDRSLIFKMKGIYSKELKNMFEALAKFASNSMVKTKNFFSQGFVTMFLQALKK